MSHPALSPLRGGTALLLAGLVALSGAAFPGTAYAQAAPASTVDVEPQSATAAPVIAEQPKEATVVVGERAELKVVAEGATGYRWQRATDVYRSTPDTAEAWVDVDPESQPTAVEAVLVFDTAVADSAGIYRVIASNDGGETVSETVELKVDVTSEVRSGDEGEPDRAQTSVDEPAGTSDDDSVDSSQNVNDAEAGAEAEVVAGEGAPEDAAVEAPAGGIHERVLQSISAFSLASAEGAPLASAARSAEPEALPVAPVFWDPARGVLDLSAQTFSTFGVVGNGSKSPITVRLQGLESPGAGDGRTLQAWTVTSQRPGQNGHPVEVIDGISEPQLWYYSTETEQQHELTVRVGYLANESLPETIVYESRYTYRTVPMNPNPVLHEPTSATVRVGESVEVVFTASGHPVPFVAAGQQFWNVTTAEGVLLDPYALPEAWRNVFPEDEQPRNGEFHYRIAAVTPEMDGMTISAIYQNVGIFGNGFGQSPVATLTVTDYEQPTDWRAPSITKSPEDVTIRPATGSEGTIVTLETEGDLGNPDGVARWQWKKSNGEWKDIAGDDASGAYSGRFGKVLRIWASEQHSGNSYRAVYSNRLGEVVSEPARLLVQGDLSDGTYWGENDPLVIYSVPEVVSESDDHIAIGGRRWLDPSEKSTGSVVSVRIAGLESPAAVRNPATGENVGDTEILAAVKASKTGRWLVEIPRPEGLVIGESYTVTIRSGELKAGDAVREETGRFTYAPAAELATITEDLPDEFVLANTLPGGTLTLGATAPTPITYRWEYRRALETQWRVIRNENYDVFQHDGATLTAQSSQTVLLRSDGMLGGEIRVAAITSVGTVYSTSSKLTFASDERASVTFDASRSYTYGDTITVTGSGFDPASRTVRVRVGPMLTGGRVDAQGNFTANLVVVGGFSDGFRSLALLPGEYPVLVHGSGRVDGEAIEVAAEAVTIAPDTSVAPPVVEQGFAEVTEVPEGEPYDFAPTISGENLQTSGYLFSGESWRTATSSGGQAWSGLSQTIGGDLATWDEGHVSMIVWNSGGIVQLDTEIDVIPADGSPSYPHVTGTSTIEGDAAVVWADRDAETGTGKSIRLSGKHWLDASGTAGSLIAVKLNYEQVNGQTGQYERSGDQIVLHPKNGTEDITIWKIIQANADGSFNDVIDLPENLRVGQRLTATVSSGVFKDGDVSRSIVTSPITVGGVAWEEDTDAAGVCTPSTDTPTWSVQEQSELGGTLKLSGQGWCHPRSGGSTIAIKIDDGAYSHLTDDLNSNRTIWDIVYADDETGDWSVELQLPDGTTSGAKGSSPAFTEGEHSIRLLTGTLKEGDAVRTIGTPTGQHTSFVVGEYAPNALPGPIDIDGGQLTDANTNGVIVAQQSTPAPGQWVVTVPNGAEGDWVYVDAYAGSSSRGPFPDWYQLDANKQVKLSLAGVTLQAGELKVTVQSGNQGQTGELLGWAPVAIAAPAAETPTVTTESPTSTSTSSGTTSTSTGSRVSAVQSTAPVTVPALPVKRGSQLNSSNVGQVTGIIDGGTVTLTVADGTPNQWIYAYVYTGVQTRPIGWVQLDENRQLKVDIADLPDGNHKIALVGTDGALIGWASAAKGQVTAAKLQQQKTAEAQEQVAEQTELAEPVAAGLPVWLPNALLGGGALLLLGGAVATALVIRNRRNAS